MQAVAIPDALDHEILENRLTAMQSGGVRRIIPDGPPDPLDSYLQMLATNTIPGCTPLMSLEDLPAGVPYEITGGTSTAREVARRGP